MVEYFLQLMTAVTDIQRRAKRVAVRVAVALLLLMITAGFGLTALGFAAFALYHTLIGPLGHGGAATATAIVLLLLAAITGLIMTRLLTTRRSSAAVPQIPAGPYVMTLAVIALLGGIAAGSALRRPRR